MNVGIIGTGNMGRTLGVLFSFVGHHVFFGARDLAKAQAAAGLAGEGARAGTNDEAAKFGDVLVYGLRGVAPADVLSDLSALDGKVLVDMNNGPVPEDLDFPPLAKSLAEALQEQIPSARVVKAFNTVAQETFEHAPNPLREFGVSAFVAGDDEDARRIVLDLAREIGFSPIDCGPLLAARQLEGAADLIRMLMGRGLGPMATLNVQVLPPPAHTRLGGRQESHLG